MNPNSVYPVPKQETKFLVEIVVNNPIDKMETLGWHVDHFIKGINDLQKSIGNSEMRIQRLKGE